MAEGRLDRKAFESRLRAILDEQGLARAADPIARQIRCALRIVRTPLHAGFLPAPWPSGQGRERRQAERLYQQSADEATAWMKAQAMPESELPLGASRLGGQPDLPADFEWPHYEGKPLGFLGQLNLAELAGHGCASVLPADGQLAFFYEWSTEPWGFDPAHRGAARVVHAPAGALVRHRLPQALEEFDHPSSVAFEDIFTAPTIDAYTLDWGKHGVRGDDIDWYAVEEALGELRPRRPQHHLLGYPRRVQGPMETECQLASNGFYCGDESGYEKGLKDPAIVAGIEDWMLLAQFDSDDTDYDGKGGGIGHMWGDCGFLYFWIRRQDLSARDFSRTWTILQCS